MAAASVFTTASMGVAALVGVAVVSAMSVSVVSISGDAGPCRLRVQRLVDAQHEARGPHGSLETARGGTATGSTTPASNMSPTAPERATPAAVSPSW